MNINKIIREEIQEMVLGKIDAGIYKHSRNFLYHVTNINNYKDVLAYGLLPQFGETIKQAYQDYYNIDGEDNEERQSLDFDGLLFFSEEPNLHYAHAGLGHYDLKPEEVLICVVKKNETIYHKVSDYPKFTDYKGNEVYDVDGNSVYNLPLMIETNDWFSFEEQTPVDLIYGQRLITFMQDNFPQQLARLNETDPIKTNEQTELIAKGKEGDCYKNVMDYLLDNDIPNAYIVHGKVSGRNGTVDHAWIETQDVVYDPTTGIKTDKQTYYNRLKPAVDKKYSFVQAMKMRFQQGHYGPY